MNVISYLLGKKGKYNGEDISSYLLGKKAGGGDDPSGLPKAYQKVEYIGSTGTQYINTGINANSNLKIGVTVVSPDFQVPHDILYAGGNNWRSNYIQAELDMDTTFCYGNNFRVITNISGTFDSVDIVQDKNKVYINNLTNPIATFSSATFSTEYPIYIFCYNRGGSTGEFGTYKISSFYIEEEGVKLRNFVPCYRKSDGEIGLYDLISKTFFTNLGTGEFIKGNDANN